MNSQFLPAYHVLDVFGGPDNGKRVIVFNDEPLYALDNDGLHTYEQAGSGLFYSNTRQVRQFQGDSQDEMP